MPTTLVLCYISLMLLTLLQADTSDFNDLGKQLIGGFVLAVIVAIAFTFVKLRIRDKKPATHFLSINSLPKEDETSKAEE